MESDKRFEMGLKFAWDWFSYHADQRLTAFNFFLVALGALALGYGKALDDRSRWLGIGIGLLGLFVSLAFLALDVRNEELVECGREYLDGYEAQLPMELRKADKDRRHLQSVVNRRDPLTRVYYNRLLRSSKKKGASRERYLQANFFTHRQWFGRIFLVFGLAFLLATGWAVAGYPGSTGGQSGFPRDCVPLASLREPTAQGNRLQFVLSASTTGTQASYTSPFLAICSSS